MPKMKTHKGAAKRFRTTGTGKVMSRKAWRGHNRVKKSPTRWRRVKGMYVLEGANSKRVKGMLGR